MGEERKQREKGKREKGKRKEREKGKRNREAYIGRAHILIGISKEGSDDESASADYLGCPVYCVLCWDAEGLVDC